MTGRRTDFPGRRRIGAALALAAVLLSASAPPVRAAAKIPCVWTGVERVVAVGDIHGDYENFVEILRSLELVDRDLRWTGGRTHLIQNGDVMDKGISARAVLELLKRLEAEAEQAGGRVHMLLGNHEEINITGIALDYSGYVPLEQFVDFLPEDFRADKEREFLAGVPDGARTRPVDRSLNLALNASLRMFWDGVRGTDEGRMAYVAGFNREWGDWLLQKNAVIKIDDTVFVHGGISEKYVTWPLEKINTVLRDELKFVRDQCELHPRLRQAFRPRIVYDPQGPLWYRELALMDEARGKAQVDRTLRLLKAKRMVIAHTIIRNAGGSPIVLASAARRFDDRIWIIDTGISSYYGGELSALIIEAGEAKLWGSPPPPPTPASAAAAAPAGRALKTARDIEAFLLSAPVAAFEAEALYGRTDIAIVTLRDGDTVRRAVFKSIDRRRPRMLPDSFKYEIAAYRLARHLGSERVPPVVERVVENRPGSLQIFVENSISHREMESLGLMAGDPERLERDLSEVRILEILTAANGGNGEDILIGKKDQAVFRVDFSEAFRPDDHFPAGALPGRCPRGLFEALNAWDDAKVEAMLREHLRPDELRALSRRKDLVAAHFRRLIDEQGEAAVLFSP